MSDIPARFSKLTGQYRCGMSDCNAVLAVGKLDTGELTIKCKCGVINKIAEQPIQHRPESRSNGESFQDNMKLTRKGK